MKKLASILFILLFYFLLVAKPAQADVIFEDDFNSYTDESFPTKWSLWTSSCNPVWKVQGGVIKISLGQGCGTTIIPNSTEWPTNLDEYIFETDIRFISGVDRHITYRLNESTGATRVLHFVIPGDVRVDSDNPNFTTYVAKNYQYNVTYRFKMIVTSQQIKVYLINQNGIEELIRDVSFNTPLQPGSIGLGTSPGSGGIAETWFDNVRVTSIDDNSLSVPLLKQTDPLWIDDIYDSANLWSSDAANMGRWGCAVTSAAMILNYHKITKLPDGTNLTPATLNSYLKSIPGGYHGNGLTNWAAIASMTLQAKDQNPGFNYDALQFKWGGNNVDALTTDIENNIPNILDVPLGGGHHFVVAKGVDDNKVLINDPGFERNDLSAYGNSYLSTRRFIPSNTDLSYLIFDVDPQVDIVLKDEFGNEVAAGEIEGPIADPLGLLVNTTGSLKILNYGEPLSGNYTLEVSSNSDSAYDLNGFIYDLDGDVKVVDIAGVVEGDATDVYSINFNKSDSSQANIAVPSVSFESLLSDINVLYAQGHITKRGSYGFLIRKVEQAQSYSDTKIDRTVSLLENVRQQLIDDKKRGIDEFASQYLIDQISLLLNNL